jgi:hypothetical protein
MVVFVKNPFFDGEHVDEFGVWGSAFRVSGSGLTVSGLKYPERSRRVLFSSNPNFKSKFINLTF